MYVSVSVYGRLVRALRCLDLADARGTPVGMEWNQMNRPAQSIALSNAMYHMVQRETMWHRIIGRQ